jgi:hypothetical protein
VYFWLQEPASDKDEEILLRCNKAVHGLAWNPPGVVNTTVAPRAPQYWVQPGNLPSNHEAAAIYQYAFSSLF